ncbi:MAG: DNA polymerase III subunit delta [Candidatus Brocadiia bacterium]
MLFKDFVSRLASAKSLMPLYLLSGEEDFLKEQGLKLIRECLGSDMKRFSSRDFKEAAFWDEIYMVPFDGKKRIIALDIKNIQLFGSLSENLDKFLSEKKTFAVLAILAPALTGKGAEGKITKLAEKHGWLVECSPIPEYDLPRWIAAEFKRLGKNISRENAKLIIDGTGNNLSKISALVEKLSLASGNKPEIPLEIIQNLVDKDADYDIKQLALAIVNRNAGKAVEILDKMLSEGEAWPRILGYLRSFFSREPGYNTLRERYAKLLETDLAIKTGRMSEELALKTMVIKLAMTKTK